MPPERRCGAILYRLDAFPSGHAIHVGALASAATVLAPAKRNLVCRGGIGRDPDHPAGALGQRCRGRSGDRCVDGTAVEVLDGIWFATSKAALRPWRRYRPRAQYAGGAAAL